MPTPSPVSKGRDQGELGGGGHSLYIRCDSEYVPIIIVIIGAGNRKIFKKEKCCKCLQHHAYSDKHCLFNQLE
jgi:hypothetical protein